MTDCKDIACTLAHNIFCHPTLFVLQLATWICSSCAQQDTSLRLPQVLALCYCFGPCYWARHHGPLHICPNAPHRIINAELLACQEWQSYGHTHTVEWIPGAGSSCWNGLQMADGTCMPLPLWAIRSGPRRKIYYDPTEVQSATAQPLILSQRHIKFVTECGCTLRTNSLLPDPASQSG